ncbi:hypothetical protein AC1031_010963 [Aphanomyces cochlioides]|nr:hypothetical protein AC1031_010963 [Aphanomyces cochlioides]
MAKDGGKGGNNKAGAAYGRGYCDAQCPGDINFINGEGNLAKKGQCCAEMDIWEANEFANAVTPHPCVIDGVYTLQPARIVNPWWIGNHTFYGPGSSFAIDTSRPFTVVTQFITDDNTANGDLVQVNRFFVQDGKNVPSPQQISASYCNQTATTAANGGLKAMGRALKTVTLASYTNIRVGDIGSTTNVVVPPTASPSPKPATTTPSVITKASTTTKGSATTKFPVITISPPLLLLLVLSARGANAVATATLVLPLASLATDAMPTRNGTLNASPTKHAVKLIAASLLYHGCRFVITVI